MPIEDVLAVSSIKVLRQNWTEFIGSEYPATIAYVIYDKSLTIPFTGLIGIFHVEIIPYFRTSFVWNQLYTAL